MQPRWLLKKHRVVNHHRAERTILVVQKIQFVNHLVNALASHIRNIRRLVAKHTLPRTHARRNHRRHRSGTPPAFRFERPRKIAQFRIGPQRPVHHRPLGHGFAADTHHLARKRLRVFDQFNNRILARSAANVIKFRHILHLVRRNRCVHPARNDEPIRIRLLEHLRRFERERICIAPNVHNQLVIPLQAFGQFVPLFQRAQRKHVRLHAVVPHNRPQQSHPMVLPAVMRARRIHKNAGVSHIQPQPLDSVAACLRA